MSRNGQKNPTKLNLRLKLKPKLISIYTLNILGQFPKIIQNEFECKSKF